MTPVSLTVCVCVRNGEDFVDRCLSALVREAKAFSFKILVVDHLSTDRTAQKLALWARENPALLTIENFRKEGLASARDHAWRSTSSEWVGFIDADCEVQKGWGEAAVKSIQFHGRDPRCGSFGGTNLVPRNGRLIYKAYGLLLSTYVGGHSSLLNRALPKREIVEHTPTLNVVYRRAALDEINGFDPVYTRVGEDLDLSFRLKRAGFFLWSNPEMVVEHALRPTLKSWIKNMFLYGRGRCFFIKRHPDSFELKFMIPLAIVILYGTLAVVSLLWSWRATYLGLLIFGHSVAVMVGLWMESRRQRSHLMEFLLATFMAWLTHLTYGAGMARELLSSRQRFL